MPFVNPASSPLDEPQIKPSPANANCAHILPGMSLARGSGAASHTHRSLLRGTFPPRRFHRHRTQFVLINDCPHPLNFPVLLPSYHSSLTQKFQRNLCYLAWKHDSDCNGGRPAQTDRNFNEYSGAADVAGFPLGLLEATGAVLPPYFNRQFHWNPLARATLLHAYPDSQGQAYTRSLALFWPPRKCRRVDLIN